MSDLVARTGRHQQRYEAGHRLVAGYVSLLFISPDIFVNFVNMVALICSHLCFIDLYKLNASIGSFMIFELYNLLDAYAF